MKIYDINDLDVLMLDVSWNCWKFIPDNAKVFFIQSLTQFYKAMHLGCGNLSMRQFRWLQKK